MLDLSYVMQIEQLERLVLAERTALLSRPGMQYEDVPTVQEAQGAFDEYLSSEPEQVEPDHLNRLQALGLL